MVAKKEIIFIEEIFFFYKFPWCLGSKIQVKYLQFKKCNEQLLNILRGPDQFFGWVNPFWRPVKSAGGRDLLIWRCPAYCLGAISHLLISTMGPAARATRGLNCSITSHSQCYTYLWLVSSARHSCEIFAMLDIVVSCFQDLTVFDHYLLTGRRISHDMSLHSGC